MSRPTILNVGNTVYWSIYTYTDAGVLVDADSTPTVAVRKNGAATADSVTVTKRAATTGIYDCSYNPAGESDGDMFELVETATISSQAYVNSWTLVARTPSFDPATDTVARVTLTDSTTVCSVTLSNSDMRGTDSASTFDPSTDTVARVTLVDTTTANTDMRGTDSASTFDPATDVVAQVTLVDTTTANTDMRGTDGASTFDPATDTVARVTLVDTTTANTDMVSVSGLATAASIAALNDFDPATDVVAQVTLVDTTTVCLVTQSNTDMVDVSGLATSSEIAALNDFDPSTDVVANVTTVSTCTVNSDMRGTDGANTVVPDNTSIAAIEVIADKIDTALQADGLVYQWTTNALELAPTGGGGGGNATLANQTQILSDIAALNDFDPGTDTVARVTLVDTTTTSTDMVDISGLALESSLQALNDISAQDVYTVFTTGNNADSFKADVTSLASQTSIYALNDFDPTTDVVARVTLVDTTTVNTDMVDISALATSAEISALNDFDPATDVVARVTLVDTTTTSTDMVDISGLATSAEISALNDFNPATDTVANVTLVDTTTTNTDMRGTDGASTFDPAVDAVANVTTVTTVDTCTTNSDMRGTDGANTVAPGNSDISEIKNKTDQLRFTVGNQVDSNALSGSGGTPVGPGGVSTELVMKSAGQPVDNAAVWISTDAAGTDIIAGTLYTNMNGKVSFMLDVGSYYVWASRSGVQFPNPTTLTVT